MLIQELVPELVKSIIREITRFAKKIGGMRYGVVEIIVQDGKPVRIRITEGYQV
ncbi:MAG: DUF2292 domain-containing protein [Firmicutes bacterium]|nr:DUF2292 domain-containing protein [Bacillota bacterium]